MKILVTGYNDFQGDNPTKHIADALQGQKFHGVDVVSVKIDVSWAKAWKQISEAVTKHKPDALVSFGVWGGIKGIKLETIAHNMKGGPEDVDKKTESGPIVEGGPSKLATTIPYGDILEDRKREGDNARVQILPNVRKSKLLSFETNFHAGTYLCNYAMYNNLYQYCAKDIPVRGFVHVRDTGNDEDGSIETLKQSAAFVIQSIAKWMTRDDQNRHDGELMTHSNSDLSEPIAARGLDAKSTMTDTISFARN